MHFCERDPITKAETFHRDGLCGAVTGVSARPASTVGRPGGDGVDGTMGRRVVRGRWRGRRHIARWQRMMAIGGAGSAICVAEGRDRRDRGGNGGKKTSKRLRNQRS
jgi:hypothetical protein